MSDLSPLGDAVRRARGARKLTIRELSSRSGLSPRFLSDLELGRGNISIARLIDVARALEISLGELVAPIDAAAARGRGDARPSARSHKPRLALVGLRGAGKSTIGRRAARKLGLPFIELDLEIERAAGLPLQQIFEIYGEGYFRRLEREVLARVLREAEDGAVIATGGGIVMDTESWRLLKRSTRTLWLRAKPEDHYRRVMAQGDTRPMKNRPSAMAELRQLLQARSALYADADVTVDTSTLGIARAIDRVCAVAAYPGAQNPT